MFWSLRNENCDVRKEILCCYPSLQCRINERFIICLTNNTTLWRRVLFPDSGKLFAQEITILNVDLLEASGKSVLKMDFSIAGSTIISGE